MCAAVLAILLTDYGWPWYVAAIARRAGHRHRDRPGPRHAGRQGRHPVVRGDPGRVPRASRARAADHGQRRQEHLDHRRRDPRAGEQEPARVAGLGAVRGGGRRLRRASAVPGAVAGPGSGLVAAADERDRAQDRRARRGPRRGDGCVLNQERSINTLITSLKGVPIVVPLIAVLLVVWTFVLSRTAFGRHLYAVGGNTEAARRAGIKVDRIKIAAFMICSTMAAVGGILAASRANSVDPNTGGSNVLLYAVGAAVIGGTSLFGGKGRVIDAVLGGAVVAVIDNGMGLLGYSAGVKYVVTGVGAAAGGRRRRAVPAAGGRERAR